VSFQNYYCQILRKFGVDVFNRLVFLAIDLEMNNLLEESLLTYTIKLKVYLILMFNIKTSFLPRLLILSPVLNFKESLLTYTIKLKVYLILMFNIKTIFLPRLLRLSSMSNLKNMCVLMIWT
jgi:hypothetical protein